MTPTPDTGSLPGTALETFGKIIPGDLGRDSIHLATIAVQSDERLFPGQHVGMTADNKTSQAAIRLIGIVDPFLPGPVFPGQWFWLTLYPRTITSLRHVWTHPAFGAAPTESVKWLSDFATQFDLDYDGLMAAANDYLKTGEIIVQQGSENWRDAFYSHDEEFWKHFEIATGKTVKQEERNSFFSCSC